MPRVQADGAVSGPGGDRNQSVLCLSAMGKAAITKDTELGMISWEQAFEGITHGLPGLIRDDFEMVATDDDWVSARLPQGMMFELLRTPNYDTIQGECWQFCCQQPMVFVGEWNHAEFSRGSPDGDGGATLRRSFKTAVRTCGIASFNTLGSMSSAATRAEG